MRSELYLEGLEDGGCLVLLVELDKGIDEGHGDEDGTEINLKAIRIYDMERTPRTLTTAEVSIK